MILIHILRLLDEFLNFCMFSICIVFRFLVSIFVPEFGQLDMHFG